MRYRILGSTGLSVSVIGFGASPLGNVFSPVPQAGDDALVGRAVDAGINFFDVSPYYGDGLAEERLGTALVPHRRNVVLATKCGRNGSDRFDFSAKGITASLETSLRRLRTDAVDLIQAHDIEFGDIDQVIHETIPALWELKRQGKARYVGITGYWPGLLARVAAEAPVDTVLNYCHWNLFSNDMDEALCPAAARLGIGLINASPLHMGILGGVKLPEWHPAPPAVRAAGAEVVGFCRSSGVDPATLSMWTCLQHPSVASTLMGFASAGQVDSACAALDFDPDAEVLQTVQRQVSPVYNTSWPQGRPENEDTKRAMAGLEEDEIKVAKA
ncbi:aldo/keto reductase [Terriglobus albidus]|uniref:aldo/keto reductase n=1 Tax=Terriglobus albidus TaxID=1592106 RepID=UPI0021DF95E6|nr:aldo/keto reductase [Terriglobus albidus]